LNKRELIVLKTDKGSVSEKAGIKPYDVIKSINGNRVEDVLDFHFYSIEDNLSIELKRENQKVVVNIDDSSNLGIEFCPMKPRRCGNSCIFCFVDQNPPGLRKNLYFKDEDYRYSFLHGNFVTLTNITKHDMERIAEQRLSPLYISVHAVDPDVREKMLGLKKDDHLLEKIKFLTSNNIELHGQIVLCPGINDEEILQNTIESLSKYYPDFRSLAVVPVGLTSHRAKLPPLKRVNENIAREILKNGRKNQKKFIKKFKESFVYFSDEFYLKAGEKLPDKFHYGEFWQIENGVGLVRDFIDNFREEKKQFPKIIEKEKSVLIITGKLAVSILEKHVIKELNKIKNLSVKMHASENSLYGPDVTVSGLLCGKDFINAGENTDADTLVIPGKTINNKGLFLDNLNIGDVEKATGKNVIPVDNFAEMWGNL